MSRILDEILERVAADPEGPEARALQTIAKRVVVVMADFEASMQRVIKIMAPAVQRAMQP